MKCSSSLPALVRALLFMSAVECSCAVAAPAQTPADARLRRAITLYNQASLNRAMAVLDSIVPSLSGVDRVTAHLYRGYVEIGRGERSRAIMEFQRAQELSPQLRLPPATSRDRADAFEEARRMPRLLAAEDFSGVVTRWAGNRSEYRNGKLVKFDDDPNSSISSTSFVYSTENDGMFADHMRYEVSLSFLEGVNNRAFGLHFGCVSGPADSTGFIDIGCYQFSIAAAGAWILFRSTGRSGDPDEVLAAWRADPAINQGIAENRLMVETRGRQVFLYCNGVLLDSVRSREPIVGIAGFGTGGDMRIAFDDFRAFELNPGMPESPPSIPPVAAERAALTGDAWDTDLGTQVPLFGGVRAFAKRDGGFRIWFGDPQPAAVFVRAEITQVSGPENYGIGLQFGHQPGDSTVADFVFLVSGDGSSTVPTILPWRRDPAVRPPGLANSLGIVIQGLRVNLWVNGSWSGEFLARVPVVGVAGYQLGAMAQLAEIRGLRVIGLR